MRPKEAARIAVGVAGFLLAAVAQGQKTYVDLAPPSIEIDVDGAPNAYGPGDKKTLDREANAHELGVISGRVVGYITENNDGHTPVLQGRSDPFPGYYISTTAFSDAKNKNKNDPRKYVDASAINYVVLGSFAIANKVHLGDFVVVYSKAHKKFVYAIVGDSGNSGGGEASLALLNALGYHFTSGRSGEVREADIVIRYFPGSNPEKTFFTSQAQLDREAAKLALNTTF